MPNKRLNKFYQSPAQLKAGGKDKQARQNFAKNTQGGQFKYDHLKIEKKWQKEWGKSGIYSTKNDFKLPKSYILDFFPYPSGEGLHVGHPKGYIATDIYSRFKRMNGFNVLHPMGWDAFGLPAENYAIKNKIHPEVAVKKNIKRFKEQLGIIGFDYDWSREINTTDPKFYKWTQWIFLQMFKKGLAYQSFEPINWCPSCQTGLANEDLETRATNSGQVSVCERCGSEVEKKPMRQWVLKITDYADRLLNDLDKLSWPESIKESQRNWIGRSKGAEIDFPIESGKLKFVILHGYKSNPTKVWFPWLKNELEKRGHEVIIPHLPITLIPNIANQTQYVLDNIKFDDKTVLVGHSLGSVVGMRILERLKKPIKKFVIVAGLIEPKFKDKPREAAKFVINWQFNTAAIRQNAGEIVTLHDESDYLLAGEQGDKIRQNLGGKLVKFNAEKPHCCGHVEPVILDNVLDEITVFTTRPDTLFGATYIVLSPEKAEEIIKSHNLKIKNWPEIEKYARDAKKRSEIERTAEGKEKTGVELKGIKAVNPGSGEKLPIFVADYVLSDYGTGAIMAVPAHDERDWDFAKKYGLPVREVIIPERIDKRNPPQKNKKKEERHNVQAIVKNPKTGQYLYLHSLNHHWNTFPMGGVNPEEDIIEAARREVAEETGYINLNKGKLLGGQVRAEYFAKHKDVNRISYTNLVYFELLDEKRIAICDESDKNEILWADKEKLNVDFMVHAEMDIWLKRLENPDQSYINDGVLINSDKFSGLSSEKAKSAIIKFVRGRTVVRYKLRDWVFSRQRYWGEPIPIIHCPKCTVPELKNQTKLSLNFYYTKIWSHLMSGIKTIETRALNPEEKDRYFGNTKAGDLLHFVYRAKNNKKLIAEAIFRVKAVKIYKSLDELLADKEALARMSDKKHKSLKSLEKEFSFTPDYLKRINKNGLIAWEIEPVTIPIAVPENKLPVTLPKVKSYKPTGTGESPLADISKWVNTKCPVCGGNAKRETNTMPQWAGSSWYYLRFCDPGNRQKLADLNKIDYWLDQSGVDMYVGGTEHATRHLIYARFWHKFLLDIGATTSTEPFAKLKNQGMILGADGRKMSKRWGNVVNPDDMVKLFGADSLRIYEMFMGPFSHGASWSTDSIIGSRRFLEKIFRLAGKVSDTAATPKPLETILHQTIKKIGEDIEAFSFNTSVSALMILGNEFEKQVSIKRADFLTFLKLLAPFAPHATEELWHLLSQTGSIHLSVWPTFEPSKIESEMVKIAVQIDGKVRDSIIVSSAATEAEVIEAAQMSANSKKWLAGRRLKNAMYVKDKIVTFVTEEENI